METDNMTDVIICASMTASVSDKIAERLRSLGGTAYGELAASDLAAESNDLARIIHELQANGAESVWIKRISLLENKRGKRTKKDN